VTVERWRGEAAVRLASGDYEAVFLPQLGMLGASLRWRGAELLSLHGGLAAYRSGRTTGMPLLHPWANRLSRFEYRADGMRVDLEGVPLRVGPDGLPRHGTMGARPGWQVMRLEPGRLTARFDYADEELLAAFPFPHELEVRMSLDERGLRVETAVRPTSERPVPVAFGWHPYFRVPGTRQRWLLHMPPCRRLELDERGIPTGDSAERRAEEAPLGDRAFDDLFALGRDRRFSLEGGVRRIMVRFGAGYPFAQIFAPTGRQFAAIEPMTAPTDALVTGNSPLVRPGERFAAAFTVSAA
jgi:aldose 1-epimerase